MLETRTGNTLSTESEEAANLYLEAVDLILGSESGAADALDQALDKDPDFALAAAARYYLANDVGEHGADAFRELAERTSLNASDWERTHNEVLLGMIDQPGATLDKARAYVSNSPADLLVISQIAGYFFFYGGVNKLDAVLNFFESVESTLSEDWAFLARYGFAASEAGQRKRGRELLEQALAIRPRALYSIHGLAHMLHDDGAAEESATVLQQWLEAHESGAREGQMYGHVQWHLALAEWQLGKREAAMQRYLEFCSPETTTCGPVLTLADCGGFLLREYLDSGTTKPLENDVIGHIDRVWGMMGHPFIVLHVAGLYASAGDLAGLERCEETVAGKPESSNREISLALVSALIDLVKGNHAQALQTLETLSPGRRIGIGGSNVERILIDLIESSCKDRQKQYNS